jgi:hypothetical protein
MDKIRQRPFSSPVQRPFQCQRERFASETICRTPVKRRKVRRYQVRTSYWYRGSGDFDPDFMTCTVRPSSGRQEPLVQTDERETFSSHS